MAPRRGRKNWRTNAWSLAKTGVKMGLGYLSRPKGQGGRTTVIKAAARDFGGVTTQHDQRTIYRAKKMPYRKKKKWVAFTKKVKAVEISDRAKSTLLINGSNSIIIPATSQAWTESHIYSFKGTEPGTLDMKYLLEDTNLYKRPLKTGVISAGGGEETINPSDIAFEDTRKTILMSSATLDNTYTNSGSVGIEMDLYTIVYPRQSTGTCGSFLSSLDQNNSYVPVINTVVSSSTVAASPITKTSRGATLFDLPYGMSRTGAKIVKKEKFFIAPGNSITKNLRDPKNHKYRMDNLDLVYQNKNLTQTLVACYKVVTSQLLTDGSMTLKSTRSYKYTYEGGATPYNRYIQEVSS